MRFIVVEFGSTAEQSTLDRYIRGDNVPRAQLERVWKTTSQPAVWESPVYVEFFAAVRDVNMKRPAAAQIQVLAGDPPAESTMSRDASALAVLKEQVLQEGGKALVIYGSGHLYRTSHQPSLRSDWRRPTTSGPPQLPRLVTSGLDSFRAHHNLAGKH